MKYSKEDVIARAKEVIKLEARAVMALKDQFNGSLVDVVNLLLHCQGHVLVSGVGTSHAVAQRFAHLLSCCGTPAICMEVIDSLHGGSGAITTRDIVFIISKDGLTSELYQFAKIAQLRGAKIIVLTENEEAPLCQLSEVVLSVKVENVDIYDMIATGSSLVNNAVCDALCVLLLELRGYSRDDFGKTHPGGAIGIKLEKIQNQT